MRTYPVMRPLDPVSSKQRAAYGFAFFVLFVALWAWVAIEIQMMQPYIDLERGNAPAEKSLLLDYTRSKYVTFLRLST